MSNTNGMVAVTGNTYPVKDRLKALSPRVKWDGDQKAWMVPADKQAEAVAIVASAGPVQPRNATNGKSKTYRNRNSTGKCHDCGAYSGQWYRCKDCNMERKEGGSRYMGGQSYRTSSGQFVLGDDD